MIWKFNDLYNKGLIIKFRKLIRKVEQKCILKVKVKGKIIRNAICSKF